MYEEEEMTLLHMYHSHAFVPWIFCLQMCTVLAPSRFLWRKKKNNEKQPSVSLMLSVSQNNQHFSIVSISVGGVGGVWGGCCSCLITQPLH